jgi:hypothetical protein
MATMANQQVPAAPGRLRHRRVRLPAGTAAAALAVAAVRAAISEWQVPADSSLAGILASDLVITAAAGGAEHDLMLSLRGAGARFRVEVHAPSPAGDPWDATGTETGTGGGLRLAAALAAESGHYRTPAGRAVYYALALPPGAAPGGGHLPQGDARGDGEP